jgi:hypothetical protein
VAATAFSTAATALRAHASTLQWAQGQAGTAIRQHDAAARCVPPGPLGTDVISVGQSRAIDLLAQARAEVFASGNTAAATIEAATADAPINPGFWNQAGYQWSEFWHGAAEAGTGIGRLVWDHTTVRLIVDPDGWTRSTTDLATGLVAAVKDPVQLGKDVIDYDTWTTSPARAAGNLAPDAIIAALTVGGGLAATRGAEAGAKIATTSARVGAEAGVAQRGAEAATSVAGAAERGAAAVGAAGSQGADTTALRSGGLLAADGGVSARPLARRTAPDGSWFSTRPLPRDVRGVPIPDSPYPHTQLGWKVGRSGDYPQAREFGSDGRPVLDIDFTDHGRSGNHPSPHTHRWLTNETGGTPRRGPAEQFDE